MPPFSDPQYRPAEVANNHKSKHNDTNIPLELDGAVHKAEWCDSYDDHLIKTFRINSLSDLRISEKPRGINTTVQNPPFEVVAQIYGSTKKNVSILADSSEHDLELDFDSRELPRGRQRKDQLPETIDGITISSIFETRIIVHSPFLLNAIRRTISYFPSQDLTGESITICEPYMCLVHYHDELESLAEACKYSSGVNKCQAHSHESLCVDPTRHHMLLLLDFLKPVMEERIRPALKKLARPTPVITFDLLWLLFRPGVTAYSDMLDNPDLPMTVVMYKTVKSNKDKERGRSKPRPWTLNSWVLQSDGDRIGRVDCHDVIDHFEGEKEVLQLPTFPCSYWDKGDNFERKRKSVQRGKLLHSLLQKRNYEMFCDGMTFVNLSSNDVDETRVSRKYYGRAIIDPMSTAKYNVMEKLHPFYPIADDVQDRSTHLIEIGGNQNQWSEYDSIDIRSDKQLTEHHYLLMLALISGFALDDKSWRVFFVGALADVSYSTIGLKNLVLDDRDLNMIKALVHQQNLLKGGFRLDHIQGKGEGQVILLHGPPGVGKTYTVEAIAAHNNRPLLSLTIADIGMEEDAMESSLSKWLYLAETWNAVLLIDEADIFLEKRGRNHIQRNGLVSVFLRRIEYFRGLLFLTTNRVGQIDDAFSSRIHATIGYPKLDHDKRARIWESFFVRIKEEHANKIYVSTKAKDYVLNHKEIQDREWNGREIRNAFQTAAALAEFEAFEDAERPKGMAVEIRAEHFQQVMEMSKSFKEYINRLDEKNESERARARKDRFDDYSAAVEEGNSYPFA